MHDAINERPKKEMLHKQTMIEQEAEAKKLATIVEEKVSKLANQEQQRNLLKIKKSTRKKRKKRCLPQSSDMLKSQQCKSLLCRQLTQSHLK